MEQQENWILFHTVKQPDVEIVKPEIHKLLNTEITEIESLKSSQNFTFKISTSDGPLIARITPDAHQSKDLIDDELQFILYLAAQGLSVCKPKYENSSQFEYDGNTFFLVIYEYAKGTSPMSNWNWIKSSSFARQYGKWLGLLHNHSQNYRPNPTESFLAQTKRVAWNQVHSNLLSRGSDVFVPKGDDPDSLEVKSLKEYNDLMEWINTLPKTQENYGLIHGDLNISNFFITEEQNNNENNSNDPLSVISIDAFDWDQLQYGWFSYDISVVIWGVMLMQLGLVPDCAPLDVEWFKTEFLNGYTEVRKITEEELSYLPNFIRIRKLFYIMFCVKSLSDMKSQELTTFDSFEKFATTIVEICTK